MVNIEHYTYRITWSAEDAEFVGLCAEFPSLSWLAGSRVEALTGITALVADILNDMQTHGETPPVPLAEKHYSGKLVLRMPPDQHRRLAISASEEGVSLNRYLCARLAV
ncbi:Uncharacterized protein encoded in hypervariable junctions of pilus gene clusters [Yersinia frederiksenii]|uniref:Type II toxin-antitoxin system HicB family antitoxin n=1 Tax=Yersinia alsatica TaxID=2890317 RepID=A0ABY5UTC1_9GAMM|nr:toxin-antitoxin system HicB family antitoxin [Yersinia alsatica]OVZ88565.1 toxin-antitoxin system HicB family antitoxin [Yersinia frederiksenii]OWF68268.1 hypothetical protein B4901_14635 [Yersinia frederiksenii]OWF76063.1 hypothetical protein B4903_18125 [Yersinia frederiksenii]UWM45123.1 type II toxin-antitoxin system HicB family antitoxin [Yersinia alsatica]CFQ65230.1 Uncharacterized protein encoded in hypervariable junctions of pilus gene clusters [Yersinia frederiksenii]